MTIFLSILCIFLLAIVLGLSFFYLQLKKKFDRRPETKELQEFFVDLMAGHAILKVTRIEPSDVLIRARARQE